MDQLLLSDENSIYMLTSNMHKSDKKRNNTRDYTLIHQGMDEAIQTILECGDENFLSGLKMAIGLGPKSLKEIALNLIKLGCIDNIEKWLEG